MADRYMLLNFAHALRKPIIARFALVHFGRATGRTTELNKMKRNGLGARVARLYYRYDQTEKYFFRGTWDKRKKIMLSVLYTIVSFSVFVPFLSQVGQKTH